MSVQSFFDEAARLVARIEQLRHGGPVAVGRVSALFSELRTLARGCGLHAPELDPRFESLAKRARALYAWAYGLMETEECVGLLAGDREQPAFRSNNDDLAEGEAAAAGLGESSRLAFVGCGSFPWSALRFHALTSCAVTGIDSNPLAIDLAHRSLRALRTPADRVTLHEADGSRLDYAEFTHVLIAAMATPKDGIYDRVLATARSATRVIVRAARGASDQLFYEAWTPRLAGARLVDRVHGPPGGELSSWVLEIA